MGGKDAKVTISKDFLAIKDIIRKPVRIKPGKSEIEEIVAILGNLDLKMNEIKDALTTKKYGIVNLRKKKEIIYLVKNRKKLTASELSKVLGMSRTRSNEYLRELEIEGILRGETVNKKKYYMICI